MLQFASVRFTDALDLRARDVVTRNLCSAGATPTSWNTAGNRTYASLAVTIGADLGRVRAAVPGAVIDAPPLVVLRIVPDRTDRIAALAVALAGRGGFAGIVRCATDRDGVVIEVDVRTTPLSSIVALVDIEVGAHGRRIEPILPLGDDVVAGFAGALLREPDLVDASRLIETHLESLAGRGA